MNIDVLKAYLSEEDFLSLYEKLKDSDVNLLLNDGETEKKEESLMEEIEKLKALIETNEKLGIALSNASPVDFSLALELIDKNAGDKSPDELVKDLKDRHPTLFKDYFENNPITTSLPHTGNLPDKGSLNDKDYYDLLFQKNR